MSRSPSDDAMFVNNQCNSFIFYPYASELPNTPAGLAIIDLLNYVYDSIIIIIIN